MISCFYHCIFASNYYLHRSNWTSIEEAVVPVMLSLIRFKKASQRVLVGLSNVTMSPKVYPWVAKLRQENLQFLLRPAFSKISIEISSSNTADRASTPCNFYNASIVATPCLHTLF